MIVERVFTSEYMHWAKTQSGARFNLAVSGTPNLPLRQLEFSLDELEITTEFGYGFPPLQQALAERIGVQPESIVSAAGTSFANHLAMAAIISRGDEVWIEQPTYEPLLALAKFLGANVKRFSRRFEDRFQVDPDDLKLRIGDDAKLIVLTNLHNPSSVLLEQERLRAIGQLAEKIGCHVLVDEVYLETFFEQRPVTAFKFGPQFIVTSSLTKAFGLSGLRCGWVVAERRLAERMWRLNDLYAASPVHIAERLSLAALRQSHRIALATKAMLEKNREIVTRLLDSRADLEAVRPLVGTIVFPRLKRANTDTFIKLLRDKYETSVVPGRFFEMPSHFRLGFAVEPEVLEEGLLRIGKALDE
jgi:aspartate/methionine/tyrosine aminotransferase